MSKHTPGPWIYDTGSFYAAVQLKDNGMTHEPTIIDMGEGRPEDYEANARLIAAAPELLEALVAVLEYCVDDEGQPTVAMARAAIAKATQP